MDEESYTVTREKIVPIPCRFEKSILALRVCCSKASKNNIAEREVVQCALIEDQLRCTNWLSLLRRKSLFALQLTDVNLAKSTLPHTKEMKVQVGGIDGLVLILAREGLNSCVSTDDKALHDVFCVLNSYGDRLEEMPFEELVKSVTRFRLRYK